MGMIEVSTMSEMLKLACREILDDGKIVSPRKQETAELMNWCCCLTNPFERFASQDARDLSIKYIKKEILWYLMKTRDASFIMPHARIWREIADKNNMVNSNYGLFMLDEKQFNWVVQSLIDDKNSRQAVINFNNVSHKYHANQDFVCTISAQYMIRNNKLHAITNMRSNDLIYGLCNDVPFFTLMQEVFWQVLRKEKYGTLKLGSYFHNAASLHAYSHHFKMINSIANEAIIERNFKMPEVDSLFLKEIAEIVVSGSTNRKNSKLMAWLNDGR